MRGRRQAGLVEIPPGHAQREWIKTKHWRLEELLIGGWSPPRREHGRAGLLGETDDKGLLRYLDRVEFGITEDFVAMLQERLGPLAREMSPFAERLSEPAAVFAEPRVPTEIRYLERTSG
jgi:bifunctional non-homologous end joining protein LigD